MDGEEAVPGPLPVPRHEVPEHCEQALGHSAPVVVEALLSRARTQLELLADIVDSLSEAHSQQSDGRATVVNGCLDGIVLSSCQDRPPTMPRSSPELSPTFLGEWVVTPSEQSRVFDTGPAPEVPMRNACMRWRPATGAASAAASGSTTPVKRPVYADGDHAGKVVFRDAADLHQFGGNHQFGHSQSPEQTDANVYGSGGRRSYGSARISTRLPDGERLDGGLAPEKAKKYQAGPNLFGDLNKMKEDMRNKAQYDVKVFYHEKGFWQWLAKHTTFEKLTLGVIGFNALWMAIDTDNNEADSLLAADTVFQVAEHFFCFYFSFEWLTRFLAFKLKRSGLKDFWFVFDSTLVFMMVAETWVMTVVIAASGGSGGSSPLGNASVLRLFRLARLARMARMLRSMPELLILIKGMASAMRSVGFVLLLLLIMMYVFAIAFVLLLKGQPVGDAYFPGIPTAMYTLLVSGTFMDNITTVANDIGRDSMVCGCLFFFFVGLSALTVMNMLIGVLCEVVSSVAECEKEGMLVLYVTEKFKEIWASMDEDGTGQLSKKEFMTIMSNKEAWLALEEVDVDPMALVNLADQIFEPDIETGEEPNLTLDEFMDVILAFRGKNTATVKDMNDLRKWMSGQLHKQQGDMARFMNEANGFIRNSRLSRADSMQSSGGGNRLSSGSMER